MSQLIFIHCHEVLIGENISSIVTALSIKGIFVVKIIDNTELTPELIIKVLQEEVVPFLNKPPSINSVLLFEMDNLNHKHRDYIQTLCDSRMESICIFFPPRSRDMNPAYHAFTAAMLSVTNNKKKLPKEYRDTLRLEQLAMSLQNVTACDAKKFFEYSRYCIHQVTPFKKQRSK